MSFMAFPRLLAGLVQQYFHGRKGTQAPVVSLHATGKHHAGNSGLYCDPCSDGRCAATFNQVGDRPNPG